MAASIVKLLVDGQEAHKRKEYEKALQVYDTALNSTRKNDRRSPDILNILDLRIATYVKVGKLDLARDDAKAMIRVDRSDGRGYLRCGQLDRLAEDYSSALRWYDHGIKNVPTSDRLHDYIQTQREKTNDLAMTKIILSKAADPATTLPTELFEMVVSYLEYRQIVAILRVSKNWTRILPKFPPLVNTLDFSDAHKDITYPMMRASLRRLSNWPKTIILARLTERASDFLASHLARWVNHSTLQRLEVAMSAPKLTQLPFYRYNLDTINFGSNCAIDPDSVGNILKSCKMLTSATFANIVNPSARAVLMSNWEMPCPNLQTLRMKVGDDSKGVVHLPVSFNSSFSPFPMLTYFRLAY
jgi:F-box/TPR repeat protein Pof3